MQEQKWMVMIIFRLQYLQRIGIKILKNSVYGLNYNCNF